MGSILRDKSRAKRSLADSINDNNIAIHCYYYSILLLLKDYLIKNDIPLNTDNSSHVNILNACKNKKLFTIGNKNYNHYFYAIKSARVSADYDEDKCYNDKINLDEFMAIKQKFNKLDKILKNNLV